MKLHCLQIVITLTSLFLVDVIATSWLERKQNYQWKTLREERAAHVAQMSDGIEQAEYFKEHILKPFLRVRVSGTEGNRIVREHIKNEMQSLRWHVTEDSFSDTTPFGEKSFVNVIAVQNPSATRRLTLACHYDSKLSTFQFVAATDSAVPCAMMIDLARHLNSSFFNQRASELSLQFLFLDGEEALVSWSDTDSLYGARHLATKMHNSMVEVEREVSVSELEMIDAFFLLDLIGTADTTFSNWFSKTLKLYQHLRDIEKRLTSNDLLETVARQNGDFLNRYFTNNMYQSREFYGGIQDDHIPFLRKDVPIVHLISYPFPRVWHKEEDNESSLSYPTIRDIGKILRIFVVEYLHLNV